MKRVRKIVRLVATCCLLCGIGVVEAEEHPHIVLIMVDDMGYGDPGCFNPNSKIATPHIDSLARDGMRFTDAHAPGPLCHMSRYGLMTGEYPFRTNVGVWPREPVIKSDQMTIASLAKAQGYRTAMVGKWHLGFEESGYDQPLPGGPIDRGFESFFGIRASTDIPPYFYIRNDRAVEPPSEKIEANQSEGWSPIQGAFWRQGGIAPNLKLDEVLPRFTDEAIATIEAHAVDQQDERPMLLYLAYPAPHTPWLPSEQFAGKSNAGMYGDFAMMVDNEVGRVLAAIDQAGWNDETLVIFTSDNGPVWFPRDVERWGHASTGRLRGMKADAWEGGHRMPFIVRWPGHIAANQSTHQLVCFTDVLATMADLFDVTLPDEAAPDSFSFLPTLLGEEEPLGLNTQTAPRERTEFVMRAGSVRSMMTIRSGKWKLITGLGSGGFTKPNRIRPEQDEPAGQLYNLQVDLAETTNRYAEESETVKRLESRLEQILEQGHRHAGEAN